MTLEKLAIPITFGCVNNTRIENVMFEIVDINFSYNTIIVQYNHWKVNSQHIQSSLVLGLPLC
jgi:hypothetical protein